jgi:hypothetical protein
MIGFQPARFVQTPPLPINVTMPWRGMVVCTAVRSGTDIRARAFACLPEVGQERRDIGRRELDTQADQSPFPGKAWQQVDDAVEIGRIDVEPYVERDGRKDRAVHAIAKGVYRRP